ncbi:cytochrome ubiquinol oxidase subunit I [Pyrobaculum aerophilum]|uniref:Uncharacterized protein n=1 Tax=Pyrobaculum aerophilum TaxID=13773 RepID=A0A371R2V4_9CREN|nr:cytochrome ubiquinol oxidase subunit I [Pyrobaculum aerophilum]RFA98093.1 hypothetical protein CGL51_01805 [Pyrobaculum aerophilum]
MANPNPLLTLSALGVYFHGVYVSLNLGLPIAIGVMLWKWRRTGDNDYYRAAKTYQLAASPRSPNGVR